MGRVAKYKKIKKVDLFSKSNAANTSNPAESIWGIGDNGRKKKKRSKVAQRMHERKMKAGGSKQLRASCGADGFNIPPEEDDFDLDDLHGSLKPSKRPRIDEALVDPNARKLASVKPSVPVKLPESHQKSAGDLARRATIPETDRDEARVARILKSGSKADPGERGGVTAGAKESKSGFNGRKEGESMRSFERRVKEETRLILNRQAMGSRLANKEKIEKKKEFLKSLRKKKKRRKVGISGLIQDQQQVGDGRDFDADYDFPASGDSGAVVAGDGFVTGERAIAAAAATAKCSSRSSSLHDQVERPPEFKFIPRGAPKRDRIGKDKDGPQIGMDQKQRAAERRAMERMRMQVRAKYAIIKQKRKKAGDFHL